MAQTNLTLVSDGTGDAERLQTFADALGGFGAKQDLSSLDETVRRGAVEEAKALLAEAGYPNGEGFPTFSIKYTPSTELENVAQAMAAMWKQYLGLNCEVTAVESGVYWADETGTRASGDFDIAYMGYTLDYPEPSAAFTVLENAEGKAKTRWDCPAYLELCNKMRSDIAGQEREDLYKDMEALLAQECPVMPIYNYVATALVSERVKGFTRNANGHPNFEYCTIAE